jgi:hypothetical protein
MLLRGACDPLSFRGACVPLSFRGACVPLSFRGSLLPVIPRSAATRNLLEFCTASRRRFVRAVSVLRPQPPPNHPNHPKHPCRRHSSFPTAGSSHPFGMTREKGTFRGACAPPCHSEERSDEESPRVLHRLPPYSQLRIPHIRSE